MGDNTNENLLAGKDVSEDEIFVGSIDQDTTSSRFLIFNQSGEPVASHQVEFKQYYPQPGWHEHDPLEIISSIETCIQIATTAFLQTQSQPAKAIKAMGITNQRETTVVWDTTTGLPLHNAIVWTDTRHQSLIRQLKLRLGSSELLAICGLPLSTYPSVGKLLWLLENIPKVKAAYEKGTLAFGTIDTWVTYRLNGGAKAQPPIFVTDPTNASRTMFMNLESLKYDPRLLDFFRLDPQKLNLPEIVRSSHPTAYGHLATGILKGIPITGCLGDQSSALVGQKGFSPGRAKNTYGTGCFLLYHIGPKPVISKHGLLTTVAYDFDGTPQYALEGSIAVAGSSVKFLQNNFGWFKESSGVNELAESVKDSGGVVFVTAFSGLFAPYWVDSARGTIFGITAYTQKGHTARATLEATCFQTKAILDAMEKDSGTKLTELAVDGGMTKSDLCMQIQADLIGISIERPGMLETTALGAAIAAGFAIGMWKTFDELKVVNTLGATKFRPQIEKEERERRFERWEKAVDLCKGWEN